MARMPHHKIITRKDWNGKSEAQKETFRRMRKMSYSAGVGGHLDDARDALNNYKNIICECAEEYCIPCDLLAAIVFSEIYHYTTGEDTVGDWFVSDPSLGICQIKVSTAKMYHPDLSEKEIRKKLRNDPKFNICTAAQILLGLRNRVSDGTRPDLPPCQPLRFPCNKETRECMPMDDFDKALLATEYTHSSLRQSTAAEAGLDLRGEWVMCMLPEIRDSMDCDQQTYEIRTR